MGGSRLRSHEHQWVRREEALREAGVGRLPPCHHQQGGCQGEGTAHGCHLVF